MFEIIFKSTELLLILACNNKPCVMKPITSLITFSLLVFANILFAQYVDIKTAEKVALHFYFKQHNCFKGNIHSDEIQIKESFTEKQEGEEVIYIFNISPGGFVIIPAEKAIEPVLGYSFEGAYNPDKSHSNVSAWLQTYKNKVSYLKENKIKVNKTLETKWVDLLNKNNNSKPNPGDTKDVDPLVSALWGGDFPYNIHCPEDPLGSGGYCYVGPVGVAMGQIMYYWRYPLTGNDSIYYSQNQYDSISVNFGETDYEWTGMADDIDYYNPSPIALLLFHCAASVQTGFSPNGSGAYSTDVPYALTNYFGYDASCEYLQRAGIALSTWLQMLKNELDNLRPVYYSGSTPPPYSGHAFVVDGYQESGGDFFHINFGWTGYMNGWYLITDAGGFTQNQGMVRNIFPGSEYPYYCQEYDTVTTFSGTIDDGSGNTFNYQDNANCNWLIAPQSDNDSISGLILNFSSFHTEPVNDIVSIYDGPTNGYPLLGSFSGATLPPQIITSNNKVLINFTTNSTTTESGWLLNFESLYPVYCNTLQTYTSMTDTVSDGSGKFYYQNSTNCMWLLEPPGADEITLYFNSFETEENQDMVNIYDASNNMLLAEYSGMYLQGNPPPPVTSPSGEMLITFQSDLIYNAPGWEGVYIIEGWLPPPTSITILDSIYYLGITWSMPDTSISNSIFLGFNLFRDGTQINSNVITDTTFYDEVGPGEFEYCVTAVYEDGESNPVCASIVIPCYGTLGLSIIDSISGQGIEGITVNIGDTSLISGTNGYVEFMLPEGTYDISINATGYNPVYSSCEIICDEITNTELILIPIFPPPQNFEAEIIDESIVLCSWEPADTTGILYNLLGYNIYRNDTLINTNLILGTFYYDFSFYLGNHEYCVTSVYEVSESEKVCDEVVVETGSIEGNIYNIYTYIPVPGAIVGLGNYSDTTDASGNFYIDNIPIGSYEIEVIAENYYPLQPGFFVDILEGLIVTADIPLGPLYLNPPLNLQFEVLNSGEGVKLFWNQPLPHPWILEGYNVYLREWGIGDFEIINDELVTDTLFIDSEAGGCSNNEYYVTAVYNAGESQGSNIIFVIIPGLTQIHESNIEIYPNPAKDMIYIVLPTKLNKEIYSVDLYDNKGRIIHTGTVKTECDVPQKLKIDKLEKGIYLINIQGSAINFSRKIIVQ